MRGEFKAGDKVRRIVDGEPMIVVGPSRHGRGEWECAWMDKHLRHTDDFTRYEIELWPGWVSTHNK